MATPILLLHGGAASRVSSSKSRELIAESLEQILDSVYPKLADGGSALDAVVAAVEMLEDDPLYNAGKGSKIQSDGVIRMSASVMDGAHGRFAGCVNVQRVKNPVRLARRLLRKEYRVLSEKGGEAFAKAEGLRFSSPYIPERLAEFRRRKKGKSGTVGAVALDRQGRLAAATSTGGRGFESPHRVSDTPTSAGNFANEFCAVSATGTGEEIVELAVAARLCAQVEAGIPLSDAAKRLHMKARRQRAEFGWIAVDRRGNVSAWTTTPHLIWAMARGGELLLNP